MTDTKQDSEPVAYRFMHRYGIWLGCALFGMILTSWGLRNVIYNHISARWPTVIGTVIESRVKVSHSSGETSGTVYFVNVVYVFRVNDTEYTGYNVKFDLNSHESTSSSNANQIVKRYPVRSQVVVHYKPDNPQVCLLEPGLRWQSWILPGCGMVILGLGLLSCYTLATRRGELDDDYDDEDEA